MAPLNLLPQPRFVKRQSGVCRIPDKAALYLEPSLPRDAVMLPLAARLQSAAREAGIELELVTGSPRHPHLAIQCLSGGSWPRLPGGYTLEIRRNGVELRFHTIEGLRCGIATLRQLLREYGSSLPCLVIRDSPDFQRRGVMLDISRGRVPRLETLLALVEQLADFKINEFQLYTEHTFAYRDYEAVWRDWGALTAQDILTLDARCRQLGIDLVPNQNSFGHLRYWLEYPPLKKLSEVAGAWPDQGGAFLRRPATLAPTNPGTLRFLRGLYNELLPNFTSRFFNVGCDETWDLGRGQSKRLCEKLGKGRVYLDFLKKIHAECSRRKVKMMFWGDIILHYPDLVKQLPGDCIALDWGYEAKHPFEREAAIFAKSKIPFYACPGTSTWMSLIGRHDNAFANLRNGALAGAKNGAVGYLNTDWGDGGHPQPLAVSMLPFLAGASFSWCAQKHNESVLISVADRDVFADAAARTAKAAMALGLAHRKFKYTAPNVTPFGAVIAAPPPRLRELFCRDGLKYYARIRNRDIQAALDEVESQLQSLAEARPAAKEGAVLLQELKLAARQAAQSCRFMLWQQALANGKSGIALGMAKSGIRELQAIDADLRQYWPARNLGKPNSHWPYLKWRIEDYRRGKLHFPPEIAAVSRPSTSAD